MGLDKWILPEDDKKKKERKKPKKSPENDLKKQKKTPLRESQTLNKYTLICPKAKCRYQKVVVKRLLTENDKICPKCKGQMKVK
ncbi:MAG: hypothetical protein ACFE9R_13130 [Candidatus Hermodarchaeota archaeon]